MATHRGSRKAAEKVVKAAQEGYTRGCKMAAQMAVSSAARKLF